MEHTKRKSSIVAALVVGVGSFFKRVDRFLDQTFLRHKSSGSSNSSAVDAVTAGWKQKHSSPFQQKTSFSTSTGSKTIEQSAEASNSNNPLNLLLNVMLLSTYLASVVCVRRSSAAVLGESARTVPLDQPSLLSDMFCPGIIDSLNSIQNEIIDDSDNIKTTSSTKLQQLHALDNPTPNGDLQQFLHVYDACQRRAAFQKRGAVPNMSGPGIGD